MHGLRAVLILLRIINSLALILLILYGLLLCALHVYIQVKYVTNNPQTKNAVFHQCADVLLF